MNRDRRVIGRLGVLFGAIGVLLGVPAAPIAVAAVDQAAVQPNAIPPATWGYVVVRKAHSPTYTPAMKDRGNSKGGVNSVTWTAKGNYEVSMPGLANDTSAVVVSPVGTVARRCVV
jgi:hypothetical protein